VIEADGIDQFENLGFVEMLAQSPPGSLRERRPIVQVVAEFEGSLFFP